MLTGWLQINLNDQWLSWSMFESLECSFGFSSQHRQSMPLEKKRKKKAMMSKRKENVSKPSAPRRAEKVGVWSNSPLSASQSKAQGTNLLFQRQWMLWYLLQCIMQSFQGPRHRRNKLVETLYSGGRCSEAQVILNSFKLHFIRQVVPYLTCGKEKGK